MKNKKLKNKKGFSLLEMIIAVFIFSLVVMVAVSAFVSIVSVRKKTKEIQQNMENARVAMDGIAKVLRNSDVIGMPTATKIRVYDYSQEKCAEYEFVSATKSLIYSFNAVDPADKDTLCLAGTSLGGTFNMLSGTVSSGQFDITPSTSASVGRAVILMKIQQSATASDKALLQTTVSLRSLSQEVNPS